MAVADLNRDGISDLIVSGFNANKVSVMLGLVNTTTTLTSTVNPSVYGQNTTLNVTVSPSSAQGSVTFFDGATSLGSTGLSGGATSLDISALSVGVHSLTARYNADIFDAASTSTPVSQTVNQVTTTTSLTAAPSPTTPGKQVAPTAFTVAPDVAGTIPTGSVIFKDGGAALGSVTLDGNGQAVLATTLSLQRERIR